jgi:hypothetical protein
MYCGFQIEADDNRRFAPCLFADIALVVWTGSVAWFPHILEVPATHFILILGGAAHAAGLENLYPCPRNASVEI